MTVCPFSRASLSAGSGVDIDATHQTLQRHAASTSIVTIRRGASSVALDLI